MRHCGAIAAGLLGSLLCGAAWAADAAAEVFVKATLAAQPAYVQGAVSLQVQVFSDTKLYQARVELADHSDLRVQRIGKDVSSQETRNGRSYQVITRQYALLPQRSGEIVLDGPVLDAEVAEGQAEVDPILSSLFSQLQISGGLGAMKPLRVHGDPIRLQVRPRPAGSGSTDWLPAQQMTLDDAWPTAGEAMAAGQPVTRHLRLTAVGLSASQLPDLGTLMPLPPGLKAYPGEPRLSDDLQDGRIVGLREQDIALIADRAGSFELPALRLAWWDATSLQGREAVLPAHTLVALGGTPAPATGNAAALTAVASAASAATSAHGATAASVSGAETPAVSGTSSAAWVWISLGFGLLWLGTLGAWVWAHRRRQRLGDTKPSSREPAAPELSAAAARRAFQQACRNDAPRDARAALLAWARGTWPQDAPAGLNALARRLGHPAITPLLRELDRACLEGSTWSGEALARALTALDDVNQPKKATADLPGLYSEQDALRR